MTWFLCAFECLSQLLSKKRLKSQTHRSTGSHVSSFQNFTADWSKSLCVCDLCRSTRWRVSSHGDQMLKRKSCRCVWLILLFLCNFQHKNKRALQHRHLTQAVFVYKSKSYSTVFSCSLAIRFLISPYVLVTVFPDANFYMFHNTF